MSTGARREGCGVTHLSVNTSTEFARTIDPETGEVVGKFLYDIEVPDEESQTCYSVEVFQEGSGWVKVAEEPGVNGKACFAWLDCTCVCTNSLATVELDLKGDLDETLEMHLITCDAPAPSIQGPRFPMNGNLHWTDHDDDGNSIRCPGDAAAPSVQYRFQVFGDPRGGTYDVYLKNSSGGKVKIGQVCVFCPKNATQVHLSRLGDASGVASETGMNADAEGGWINFSDGSKIRGTHGASINIPGGTGGDHMKSLSDDCHNMVSLWAHVPPGAPVYHFKLVVERDCVVGGMSSPSTGKVGECVYTIAGNYWELYWSKCGDRYMFMKTVYSTPRLRAMSYTP